MRALALLLLLLGGGGLVKRAAKRWTPPPEAAPYLPAIAAAEAANGIPEGLLARLLDQESGFRAEVISGEVRSPAGAVGIAQIIPRWHPDVDPTDPWESIDYAARYLAALKARFGTWEKALAAYNWGEGNLANAIASFGDQWFAAAPSETTSYYTSILRDVPAGVA